MVIKLKQTANYDLFKAWVSAVDDWVFSHTGLALDKLAPSAIRSVARMTLDAQLYALLEGDGALGRRTGSAAETNWDNLMEHLRDRLGIDQVNLRLGLETLRQDGRSMKDFAREFERRVQDADYPENDAKVLLIKSLNSDTLNKLDTYIATQVPSAGAAGKESRVQRLRRISYPTMLAFLKQSHLTDIAERGAGGTTLPAGDSRLAAVIEAAEPEAEMVMTEAIPDAYAATSGFLGAGVMALSSSAEQWEAAFLDGYATTRSGFLGAGVISAEEAPAEESTAPQPSSSVSVLTITATAVPAAPTSTPQQAQPGKSRRRRRGGKSPSSTAVEPSESGYKPVDIPSQPEMQNVYKVGLAIADQVLSADLC